MIVQNYRWIVQAIEASGKRENIAEQNIANETKSDISNLATNGGLGKHSPGYKFKLIAATQLPRLEKPIFESKYTLFVLALTLYVRNVFMSNFLENRH